MTPSVFLAGCTDYSRETVEAATRRALDELGGVRAILDGRQKVLVKPNLVLPKEPEDAATTHPSVVRAVCRAFVAAGAQVTICDSPGGPNRPMLLKRTYAICGMEAVAGETGAKLSYDTAGETVTIGGRVVEELEILKVALESELVISVGKAKTHGMGVFSGAVKNLYGLVPGFTKIMYHGKWPDPADFFGMIVDLCEFIKPGLSVLDGVIGMEGPGPTAGTPKPMGVLIVSKNPHAADMAACRLMSIPPAHVHTLRAAVTRGLLSWSDDCVQLLGDPPEAFETRFLPAVPRRSGASSLFMPAFIERLVRRLSSPLPSVEAGRCVGCEHCVSVCPRNAITMQGRLPVVARRACIQCYCCHELCPHKAIHL